MKNKIFIGFSVFIIIQSALYLSNIYAQGNFRERVRERIKEKWLEKKQAEDSLGVDDYHFSFEHGGITRKYNVHLPPNYNKNVPTPVVIYLHGGGGSIKGAYQDGVDKAADKFGFILVIPVGTGPIPDKLLTWNAGKWDGGECCGSAVEKNIDDVGFIAKMIDEVKKNFNVDEKRIYATGISNGAMMSYRLACELSDKIAAVAPVASPAIPQNCVPSRSISIMQINGARDPCVPINGGLGGGCLGKATFQVQPAQEMVTSWVKMNGCSENYTTTYQKRSATCITYGPCKDEVEVEFCKVEDMGHTWPSGHQYMPVERIGPVFSDLSFEQIWEFFKRHSLRGGS